MRLSALGLALTLLTGCPSWLEAEPEPVIYTVKKGDSLWGIAKANGVSVEELRAWNGLKGDSLEVGDELKIYVAGSSVEAGGGTVSKGGRKNKKPRSDGGSGSGTGGSEGSASATAGLRLPPEQPCLAGPGEGPDGSAEEPEFAASKGLSQAQVRSAMSAFVSRTLACVPEGTQPTGTMELHLTVACTGRVAAVEVLDDGGLPPALVACVPEVLRYAPFPAHDLPDGETFRYPLSFSWD